MAGTGARVTSMPPLFGSPLAQDPVQPDILIDDDRAGKISPR
jgi:hypothetical protein